MSRSTLLTLALVLGGAVAGPAASPSPLPPFEVTSLDGGVLSSASVVQSGRWLLVYVSPYAGASAPVVRALEGASGPSVVIVVGAPAQDAKAMAARFEGRLQAAWYADPAGAARQALGLTGTPVVLGLDGDRIHWTLAGAAADRRTLRSILESWR
jgi:hypothetical protein